MAYSSVYTVNINSHLQTTGRPYTFRAVINPTGIASVNKIRVTLQTYQHGLTVSGVYIGKQAAAGDPYDFDTTPTPVLFGGSSSVAIPVAGSVVSDEILFTDDGTDTLVLSIQCPDQGFVRFPRGTRPANLTQYLRSDIEDAATVNTSGYTVESSAYIASKLEVNVETAAGSRVTQIPINVIDNSDAGVRVSQLPILLITTPAQPAAVTQLPLLTPVINKPLPIPGNPIVPEVPLIETWEWLTVTNRKAVGSEQRSGLLANPRITNKFNIIVDEKERREFYKFLYHWISKEVIYPRYHFSTNLNAPSPALTTKLYFNPALTDLRANEQIALFDPHLSETRYVTPLTIDVDGATLAEPLEYDVPARWLVCAAPVWRMGLPVGFAMGARAGTGSIVLQTTQERSLLRPGQTASPIIVDGMPVLDRLPHDGADELFNQNLTWLDNDTSFQSPIVDELTPKIQGSRTFTIPNRSEMDWWRKLGDLINGSRKPFLLPTHFDDLTLTSQPALNATRITVNNIQYARYFKALNYRYIMLVTANGKKYRKVNDIVVNYNMLGDALSVDLILASSIGNVAGDNVISKVSIVNKCRLDKDEMVFTHNGFDAKVELSIKAVDR